MNRDERLWTVVLMLVCFSILVTSMVWAARPVMCLISVIGVILAAVMVVDIGTEKG